MRITTTRSRSLRMRALASLVLVVALAPTVAAASPHNKPTIPELAWADCGVGFECATAAVPRDHRRPRHGTIDVSLIRHPAVDPANRIGTLFFAHPLGTADFVRTAPPGTFQLLAQFDVVGFDGRGTGPTTIDCGIDEELLSPFDSNSTRPGRLDEEALIASAHEYGRRCEANAGDLLPYMSTAAMARDLDLLRAAVGDEQLTYIGISQGTDIGATYATMFPGRARAMVFDAPIDAAGWRDRPLEIFREQSASYEQELDRFFLACATQQASCGFGGDDPERAFDDLLARLDAAPITSSDPQHPGPVDGDDVRTAAGEMLFDPARWQALADALVAAAGGDGAAIQAIADGATDNELALDTFIANRAVSSRYPRDVDAYADNIAHRNGLLDHFWAQSTFVDLVARLWPARATDRFDKDFENPASAPTILVIGGTHDPATPYQWAQRMVDDLGNARLFTYRSDGHGAINDGNPCVVVPVIQYLTDATQLPPEGASCEQTTEPFGG
jgi:pimeloyl-ACP methyl ester carboxylesterase